MDHPGVIKVFELSEDDRYLYIVTEHFKGRELFDKIREEGPMKDERRAPNVLSQLISVLEYLHKSNIIYRDLKLENVIYDGKMIKLFDFSKAAKIDRNKLTDLVGTLHYISPEVIKGNYGLEADIWALGVLAFVLFTGRYPFTGNNDYEIINRILYFEPEFREGELGEHIENLIR